MKTYVVSLPAAPSAGKAEAFRSQVAEFLGVPVENVLVLVGASSFAAIDVAEPKAVVMKATAPAVVVPEKED